ncbi:hypothetical protein G6M50_38160 [Agrobacterium rhizogenes]|nr:hypothetical protein [Rhizobium rhizogenes]NTJ83614.1 hypothetical protein [Rhizobium rhizogenes]
MRFLHYLGYGFVSIFACVCSLVVDFARFALRIVYGHSWRVTRAVGIDAYRKIADLKPVYRESYDTHGLSLDRGQSIC